MKLRDALRGKNRDGAPSGFSGPLNYAQVGGLLMRQY